MGFVAVRGLQERAGDARASRPSTAPSDEVAVADQTVSPNTRGVGGGQPPIALQVTGVG